jgi:hypothetical protein
MGELAKLESFRRDLALAETIEEIQLCRDAGDAFQNLQKKRGVAKSKMNEVGEYIIDAEEMEAEWLNKYFPHGVNAEYRKSGVNKLETPHMPVAPKESARVRSLKKTKEENPELYQKAKEKIKKSDEVLNAKSLYKELKKQEKEIKISEEKNKRFDDIKGIDLRHGDFKEVLKDVYDIDAIITDPPYPLEFIDCYSELSKYASEHLKDGGFCVAYSGQYNLPEVIKRMSEHLIYVWTFCLYHKGKKQLVNGVNIMCGWKPILVFSKGNKKMRFSAYDVVISEDSEKFSHEWQQSESGVSKLLEIFSEPGQLIVDPFAGGATFLKVANEMNRNCIGAEINDKKEN